MRYLFFDIECANCFEGVGKICEFGYAVTDAHFCVIEKDNIIVNPECEFDKKGFAMSKIKLSHPYSEYYRKPNFKAFYKRIKSLFEGEVIAIGHNTHADAQYLLDACLRYGLEPFDYEFVDTQKAVRDLYNREKNLRLIEVHNDFCPSGDGTQNHSGIEDALLTRDIARFICKDKDLTVEKLFAKCPNCRGEVFRGRVLEKENNLFRYSTSNKMTNRKNRELFQQFLIETGRKKIRYCLASEYERDHFKQMMLIVSRLREKGYGYTDKPSEGYYITLGDKEEHRLRYAKKNKVVEFNEFLSSIDLTERELSDPDIFDIVAGMEVNREWYARYKEKHPATPRG